MLIKRVNIRHCIAGLPLSLLELLIQKYSLHKNKNEIKGLKGLKLKELKQVILESKEFIQGLFLPYLND